ISIDCNHINKDELNHIEEDIEACIIRVSEEEGVQCDIDLWMDEAPTLMDERLVKEVQNAAETVVGESKWKLMPSGAGHDSQIFAKYVPTSMLFVPSINGVSHNV